MGFIVGGKGKWSTEARRESFYLNYTPSEESSEGQIVGEYLFDITDVGYPYNFIHSDIHHFAGNNGIGPFDVVVASPPCTEFSRLKTLYGHAHNRKAPADPEKGMELVREAKRVIDEINPKVWLIENVGGAQQYFKPFLGEPRMVRRPYYLWGNFPRFLLEERDYRKPGMQHYGKKGPGHVMFNPMISWLRARIPVPLSIALAEACRGPT